MWMPFLPFLVAISFLIVLFGIAAATTRGSRRRTVQRLRRAGRSLPWSEALARVREQRGFLVHDATGTATPLWWIPDEPKDSVLLYDLVWTHGMTIVDMPSVPFEQIVLHEGLSARILYLEFTPFLSRR